MNWNSLMRQLHRWLAISFTLAVIATAAALGLEASAVWISYLPLAPLLLLLVTGLCLFASPYLARWRSGRRTR